MSTLVSSMHGWRICLKNNHFPCFFECFLQWLHHCHGGPCYLTPPLCCEHVDQGIQDWFAKHFPKLVASKWSVTMTTNWNPLLKDGSSLHVKRHFHICLHPHEAIGTPMKRCSIWNWSMFFKECWNAVWKLASIRPLGNDMFLWRGRHYQ